ncbi:zinc finger protein 708-like isoform X1, partial [Biomphalaria pfeifferi]
MDETVLLTQPSEEQTLELTTDSNKFSTFQLKKEIKIETEEIDETVLLMEPSPEHTQKLLIDTKEDFTQQLGNKMNIGNEEIAENFLTQLSKQYTPKLSRDTNQEIISIRPPEHIINKSHTCDINVGSQCQEKVLKQEKKKKIEESNGSKIKEHRHLSQDKKRILKGQEEQQKTLSKDFTLQIHHGTPSNEKSFNSQICTLNSKAQQFVHSVKFSKKQFRCQTCAKQFCNASQLNRHQRSHNLKKSFQCE